MGYYIRVLGTNPGSVSLGQLRKKCDPALLDLADGEENDWQEVVLRHPSGEEIAVIEKNLVTGAGLGADEVHEFMEEISVCKPDSAAGWLRHFLPKVKVIYAFQLLSGTDINDGWTCLHKIQTAIWYEAGGILQADGEGFSDEEGYTILWQFSEEVEGPWSFGVISPEGHWTHFEMELGSRENREAFFRGEVPVGARLIEE